MTFADFICYTARNKREMKFGNIRGNFMGDFGIGSLQGLEAKSSDESSASSGAWLHFKDRVSLQSVGKPVEV